MLWIRDLDGHLWQSEVLITDEILDDAVWYTKAILGRLYVVLMAAEDIVSREGLTAGTAIVINQEELMKNVYYITDDMRAPSKGR